jgi:hypothetical protein
MRYRSMPYDCDDPGWDEDQAPEEEKDEDPDDGVADVCPRYYDGTGPCPRGDFSND